MARAKPELRPFGIVLRVEEIALMAAKKRAVKKQAKSQQAARRKLTATKKTGNKKLVTKGRTPQKKSAKKASNKKGTVKAIGKKSKNSGPRGITRTSRNAETTIFSPRQPEASSGGQSGDLQGLSSVEAADSESVDELLEEGNAFEAGVVSGVEDAENASTNEVYTDEVLEDDVPDEYLDKD
jgi:hypothetical protein